MPRRKNTDPEAGQPAKQPRVRKKREPTSICGTPTGEHPPGLKLEIGGMPPGCHPQQGGMDLMMPSGMHHQMGLPNGTPCNAGPAGPPPQMMDDGSNGPVGMAPPYGAGPPQGPPPDYFYQQGPPAPPPQFAPPPMFGGGPPPPQQMMMQQQQGAGAPMGPPGGVPGGPGHFPMSEQDQSHPHQMMPPMHHPHHPGAQHGGPPPSQMAGPPPGVPQMPPPHQLPHPPPMFPPGTFPRPGPFMMFPPTPSIPQPPFLEFRLQEMNRRIFQFQSQFLQNSPEHHEQFWDAFAQEFFDDSAKLGLTLPPEFSPEHGAHLRREFTIIRALIPRYFRSLFDYGVSQMHFMMRAPAQEMVDPMRVQNPELFGGCALNCENVLMVTNHRKPIPTEVHTDCRLYVEFAPFHPTYGYRIRHWFMEMRGAQEFYGKEAANSLDGQELLARKGGSPLTTLGMPTRMISFLKTAQIQQMMKPIMDRTRENNESPQIAMHNIVIERMELERQRQQVAAAATHIQTPPHPHQPGGPIGTPVGPGPGGPGQPHPLAMLGMAPPPQMPGMGPQGMPGMPPPPMQMGPGVVGIGPNTSSAAEEPKQKPKRQRQRNKAAAGNTAGGGSGANSSPTKGKKGAVASAGQQTPPGGMPPMGAFLGTPFHPGGVGMAPPPGGPPYHQDVMTVQEPSMMGCEYGEADERQISRVENSAFASAMANHAATQQMALQPGMNVPSSSMAGPMAQQPAHPQQQMGDSSQFADFEHQMQLQQMQMPANSMWGGGPSVASGGDMIGSLGPPPSAMSGT